MNPDLSGTHQGEPRITSTCPGSRVAVLCLGQRPHQTSEEERDVLQLRDVVLPVAAVFGEQRQVLQVLSAGVSWVQFGEFSEDHAPGPGLLWGVLHPGDGLSTNEHNTANYNRKTMLWRPECK